MLDIPVRTQALHRQSPVDISAALALPPLFHFDAVVYRRRMVEDYRASDFVEWPVSRQITFAYLLPAVSHITVRTFQMPPNMQWQRLRPN